MCFRYVARYIFIYSRYTYVPDTSPGLNLFYQTCPKLTVQLSNFQHQAPAYYYLTLLIVCLEIDFVRPEVTDSAGVWGSDI